MIILRVLSVFIIGVYWASSTSTEEYGGEQIYTFITCNQIEHFPIEIRPEVQLAIKTNKLLFTFIGVQFEFLQFFGLI